jgi:AcrR family transcriptional regulator
VPRLTDVVREERRAQISDAAMRCFRAHGFANTSMADIIAESGFSAGSIYSHFAGKADLARYASSRALDRRREALRAETGTPGATLTPMDALRLLLADKRADGDAIPALFQIWAESTHDEELGQVARDNIAVVHTLVREALAPWAAEADASGAPRDADAAADTVMVVMHGLVVRASVDPARDLDDLVASVASMLR